MKCSEGRCPHSLGNEPRQQMSGQAGKLKKLQGTVEESSLGNLYSLSCPVTHLTLQGVGGLDFLFFHFTDEETETTGYEMTYTSVSCSRMWYARALHLGQEDKRDSLLS